MHAKNQKTPSPGHSRREGKSRQDSPRNIFGCANARQLYSEADSIDRLRSNAPPARCPSCGSRSPGFVDSGHPEQPVACERCEFETVYSVWTQTAQIRRRLTEVGGVGHYDIAYHRDVALRVGYRDVSDEGRLWIATIDPVSGIVWLHREAYVESHDELVRTLDEAGLEVRNEGGHPVTLVEVGP